MRKTALFLLLVSAFCLSACAKDPKSRLQGKWLGDSVSNLPASQQMDSAAWAKGLAFEFTGNKMTVTIPAEQPRTGDYDIEDSKGDTVKVRVAREGGGTDSATLVFAQEDKLVWDLGEGREVVLTRLR